MDWVNAAAAIGTVGAFGVSLALLGLDRTDRRRAQARQISAWITEVEHETALLYLANGSSEPVYGVTLVSTRAVADPLTYDVLPPKTVVDVLSAVEMAPRWSQFGSDFFLDFIIGGVGRARVGDRPHVGAGYVARRCSRAGGRGARETGGSLRIGDELGGLRRELDQHDRHPASAHPGRQTTPMHQHVPDAAGSKPVLGCGSPLEPLSQVGFAADGRM